MPIVLKHRSVLPGFGLSLGYALLYLSLIVLIPLAGVVLKTMSITWAEFWHVITRPDVVSALWLSFFAAFVAAALNGVFGLAVAWVFVRYTFPGKRVLDAVIDLPFALPTAVAGIALTTLYAPNGWVGKPIVWLFAHVSAPSLSWRGFGAGHWWPVALAWVEPAFPWLGWIGFDGGWWPVRLEWYDKVAYSPIGVVVALTFIGLPFVVRTVQPVLADMTKETEEAAASLGAGRWQTFRRVIFPEIWPALVTGFTLAFARAVGEYGSVVFIAANKPFETEIAPLKIIQRLGEYDYTGATSIAVVMLAISFVMLLVINVLQRRVSRRSEGSV